MNNCKNTCGSCMEFNPKSETCGCPMNAYPNVYTYEYTYARTAADSNACGFFLQVKSEGDSHD